MRLEMFDAAARGQFATDEQTQAVWVSTDCKVRYTAPPTLPRDPAQSGKLPGSCRDARPFGADPSAPSCRTAIRQLRFMHRDLRQFALALAIVAATVPWVTTVSELAAADETRPSIAVADFGYVDTSGEPRDQSRDHAARLAAFVSALKADLAAQQRWRLATLDCGGPCRPADIPASDLLAAARKADADVLLIGGIHKMSTLVQWAKVEAIDTKSGQVLLDKLFTFRGDTDEAWQRAEAFVAAELSNMPAPQRPPAAVAQ